MYRFELLFKLQNKGGAMENLTVTCPHCGFSRKLARSVIPPLTASATCPSCRRTFAFSPGDIGELASTPASANIPDMKEAVTEPQLASTPAPSVQPPEAEYPSPQTLRFTFTGRPGEYFGIWIVNTLLKMMTVGIYSPWAKVRKRRYFYGNTLLHDSPFDYLADPFVLFRGWLIAAGFFIIYSAGSHFIPGLGLVFGLIFFLAVPWLIVRSRRYNAVNSSHRNIRFYFRPAYREAYVAFAGLYLLIPFTLGLIFPYIIYRQKRFLVENGRYGSTPFIFAATVGDFYRIYFRAFLGIVAIGAAYVSLIVIGIAHFSTQQTLASLAKNPGGISILFSVMFYVLLLIFYFCIGIYVQTAVANLTWNRTGIGDGRFSSNLRTRDMLWLYLSNAVAIACSLGLLIPWASVRLARYRFEHLSMQTSKGLDGFIAAADEDVTATGEEIGDLFGIEMDLAL
jgi:uncharacterized membrane protein YjgN (DUF898 family)